MERDVIKVHPNPKRFPGCFLPILAGSPRDALLDMGALKRDTLGW